ncbi:phosphoadenosine phosphosulfate reductase family protein [Burkholderia contaminans]|uniref:phosphoadenosine phosphosulfate reductase family protein n=1 Tax=Burkholderia contaminans TaxID=488447 RepID=UPI001CF1DF4A|nr:phosphoadenosine phosphosulfate reductase family protein [Burkholderia contaminans]MCA7889130.1 phosphoadenosine phosphosulfate reductase family protein [Burkholderia contaminans]MDN7577002.1 phosphoadenosine phosphosulfate reductase family protein [Burkholderia contaminans]
MKYETIELFPAHLIEISVEDLISQAIGNLVALFNQSVPIVVAYSGGKDSSVVAAMALHAALQAKGMGRDPFLVFTTGDTRVENPEITIHYKAELEKMRRFGEEHGIDVQVAIAQPNILSMFQVKVLTGRGLPSFANGSNDCSQDMKISPQIRLRKQLLSEIQKEGMREPVTLTGVRLAESEIRAARLKARGERHDVPVRNKDGDLVLSPLMRWSEFDVWEAIALYGSGVYPTFSDFEEVKRIYAHAAGTSCVVVADAIYEGGKRHRQGRCGVRTGCWSCLAAEDKSLANMIEFDTRYEYATGLHRLNRFMRNTQYDWSLRNWVGRTIMEGFIAVEPDTYSPKMIRMLTRFMLQLDFDEQQRARRAGEQPKFEILPLDVMVAVDAYQSLQGIARPFSCWVDYNEIRTGRVRYDIPEVERAPVTRMPETRFLHVGKDWEDSAGTEWTGLRDPLWENFMGESDDMLLTLRSGRIVWKSPVNKEFSVDMESVFLMEEFELDRLLAKHESGFEPGGITAAYKWYFQYGCLNLSAGMLRKHDEICRRTSFKDRLGLTLEYDHEDLISQTVRYRDLPEGARLAWAHKATTSGSQTDLLLEAA